MSSLAPALSFDIKSLVHRQKPGYSLEQIFYVDPEIYNHDLEKIFFADWLYICHSSQIPDPGDSYTYDIDKESIIVSRNQSGNINAFANVCRHRGSRICESGKSTQKRFVCPYHAWTYDLDGELLSARQMGEDFDKSQFKLNKLPIEVFCGFIFVSLSSNPIPFAELKQNLKAPLSVFDLDNTKVVAHEVHPIHANWKLVFENFDECYHCGPAHKEFSASHSLMLSDERRTEFDQQITLRAQEIGICADEIKLDQPEALMKQQAPYHYDRYALFDGYLTGSEDGKPVAQLLGNIQDYDSGASNVQLGNLTFLLVYCDHVVLYRFTPRAVDLTDAEIIWLVRSDASEHDVDLERMKWLWNVTTIADKDIIERNQKGVLSRFYQPGPYAPMEIYTINFIQWYLQAIVT